MKLSDGVQVLLITAGTYLFTYSFYFGYYVTKGIPSEFLSIDFISMLKIGIATCWLFSMIMNFLNGFVFEGDNLDLKDNIKIFLIRYGLLLITMMLAMIRMVIEKQYIMVILLAILTWSAMQKDVKIKLEKKNSGLIKRKLIFNIDPKPSFGSMIVAKNFNLHVTYGYFTWFLALLFLINNLGAMSAYIAKDTLMCKKDLYAIQVHDSDVLVTKDYKSFSFVSKESCEFIHNYKRDK